MADSYVCSGAIMKCTMGTSPAKLTVLPTRKVYLAGQPQANISDHKSMVNLAPFGLCRSLGFPATASATAAALGTLTPMPCMHNTPMPWMGGKMDDLIKGQPALLKSCKCQCMWGGTISLVTDGQVSEGVQYVQKQEKQSYNNEQETGTIAADAPQLLKSIFKKWDNYKVAKEAEEEAERNRALTSLSTLLANKPEWFKNQGGFQRLTVNEPGHNNSNGYTRLDGAIYLKEDVMKKCLKAVTKIQKKKKLSKKEEQALATLWHEINHNMHDTGKDSSSWQRLSKTNKYYMETANEFVSRKTLEKFYDALGIKMRYPVFMSNRENTGYNKWVVKYQEAIKKFGLDEKVVLDTVKKGLYEGDYHNQRNNLKNGLFEGGKYIDNKTKTCGFRITENQAKNIVNAILDPQISLKEWKDYLKSL